MEKRNSSANWLEKLICHLLLVMSITMDSQPSENNKKHPVVQRLEDLHLNEDGEPNVKRCRVEELPGHFCGKEPYIFVDIAQAEELCVKGRKVAITPHTTHCGHTYCGEFIEVLKRDNIKSFRCAGKDEDSLDDQCPETIVTSDVLLDTALDKRINRKKVKCSNVERGCAHICKLRQLQKHLANECDYANTNCPNCNREFERRLLLEHQATCRSKACEFASIGCEHIAEPGDAPSTSASSTRQHSPGLHMALMYQQLSSIRSVTEFSATTLDAAMTSHSRALTSQEQTLHMLNHPDEQRSEGIGIHELRNHYINKRIDARSALEKYNRYVHMDYAVKVAEPVLRMRNRSQWLEHQEEERNEFMDKFMQETNEAPILLNQGSMIFKLTDFSEKRMKAIKGDLKRGVYGPLFYTHEFGYLMVPIVYPNGDGGGAGTHLSIFIAIKKGKFDSLLRWPVVGRITISILSQRRVGRETVRHSFKTDVASLSYHRPSSEMNQASGIPRALDLNLLKQPSDFLVDDTLYIQIVVEPQM